MGKKLSFLRFFLFLTALTVLFAVPVCSQEAYLGYVSNSWTQVTGNNDAYMDPGESWLVNLNIDVEGDNAWGVDVFLQSTYFISCTAQPYYISVMTPGTIYTVPLTFHISESAPCGSIACFKIDLESGSGFFSNYCAFTKTIGAGTAASSTSPDLYPQVNSTSTKTLTPDHTVSSATCVSAIAGYRSTNYNSQGAKSALLRHVANGTTVSLRVPPSYDPYYSYSGTDVTSFYKANGPGTYQMEWITGSSTVSIRLIGMNVTDDTYSCNTWTGDSCDCTHPDRKSVV